MLCKITITNFTTFKVVSRHFTSKNPFDIQGSNIISKYVEDYKHKMTDTYKQLQEKNIFAEK